MIKGSIPITWTNLDYKNLSWRTYTNATKNFKSEDRNTHYNDMNVYTCSDNLPGCFLEVGQKFNLQKVVVAVNKMTPGQILPCHRDLYETYRKNQSIEDISQIRRIIVFLENTKIGHQLWIEDQICVGTAGDYFGWSGDKLHLAANLGIEDRYTLQITGVLQ